MKFIMNPTNYVSNVGTLNFVQVASSELRSHIPHLENMVSPQDWGVSLMIPIHGQGAKSDCLELLIVANKKVTPSATPFDQIILIHKLILDFPCSRNPFSI